MTAFDPAVRAWWDWMWPMAWQVALLAAAVLAATLLARKRSPHLRYWLWCLVLVKLCVPPTLAFVTGIGGLLPAAPAAGPVQVSASTPVESVAAAAPASQAAAPVAAPPALPVAAAPRAAFAPSKPTVGVGWKPLLFALWAAGLLGMASLLALQYAAIRRRLARGSAVTDAQALTLLAEARESLGVRRAVGLVTVDGIGSPVLFGLLRPRIVLPASALALPAEELRPILLHELAHLRRRDLWVNWAQAVLQSVYWFHPAVWLANARLRRERELIVDDMVLARLGGERTAYGASLLSILKASARRRMLTPGYVGIAEPPGSVAARVRRILDGRRKLSLRLGIVGAAVVLALGLILIPQGRAEQPTTLSAGYEKAPGSRDLSINVGDETFKVNAVVRWDRNGEAVFEDGLGSALGIIDMKTPDFSAQARWMDIAWIYTSPDAERYDLIELRVFDHATREPLTPADGAAVGCDVLNSIVRLRSVGRLLPDGVDVWMRLVERPKDGQVWRMDAKPGATTTTDSETVTLQEMHPGKASYTMRAGQIEWGEFSNTDSQSTVVFDIGGSAGGRHEKFQLCVVTKDGRRVIPDYPHFLWWGAGATTVVTLDMPADQLDHIELWPFTDREKFYFDGVRLPRIVGGPLQPAPAATVDVGGGEGAFTSPALSPIGVKVRALRGRAVSGVSAGATSLRITPMQDPAPDRDTASTVVCELKGLQTGALALDLLDAEGHAIPTDASEEGSAWGNSGTLKYITVPAPLSRIAQVRVRIGGEASAGRAADTGPYRVALPNGTTVELVGLAHHPSKGGPWWQPDGSPLENAPKATQRAVSETGVTGTTPLEFVFSAEGLPDDADWTAQVGSGPASALLSEAVDGRPTQRLWRVVSYLKEGAESTTLRLGVAPGDWDEVGSQGAVGVGMSRSSGPGGTAVLTPPSADGGGVSLAATHSYHDQDLRVVAVDKKGELHASRSRSGMQLQDGLWMDQFRFDGLSLQDVREFQLQARPYRWAEFRNVSLEPGWRTDVQAVVDSVNGNAPKAIGRPVGSQGALGGGITPEEKASIASLSDGELAGLVRTGIRGQREMAVQTLVKRGKEDELLSLAKEGPTAASDIVAELYAPQAEADGTVDAKERVDRYIDWLEEQLKSSTPTVSPQQAVRSLARVALDHREPVMVPEGTQGAKLKYPEPMYQVQTSIGRPRRRVARR